MRGIESWDDFETKTSLSRKSSLATTQALETSQTNIDIMESSDEESESESDRISIRKPVEILSLDKVQKSLLDFYISLLNNSIEINENDCSLVIALAVLGVTKKGFQGPETYSSQLFAILKISRFFVLRFSYKKSTSSLNTNIDSDDSDDSEFLGLGLG